MTMVYSLCVFVHVCISVCSGQATRVWQQASTVTGDTLETVTGCQLYTIIRISLSHSLLHYATHLSSHTPLHLLFSICIHSIHILPVFLFFFSAVLPLCFLCGSQWDLNKWTFCLSIFCLSQWMMPAISTFAYSLLFFPLCIYSSAVTSAAPSLTHLVYTTWHSGCWSLNPIFSFLLPSPHCSIPPSSDLTNPRGRELSLSKENRAVHCWGAPTSDAPRIRMGTHIYIYIYTTQGIIQVHRWLPSVICCTIWVALSMCLCLSVHCKSCLY